MTQMRAQKAILKFRQVLYALNRDVRQHSFGLIREYLENELTGVNHTNTEHQRLVNLLGVWQWALFDTASTEWWSALHLQHTHCVTLLNCMQIWIDNEDTFSDKETIG